VLTARDRSTHERVFDLPIKAWKNNGDITQHDPLPFLTFALQVGRLDSEKAVHIRLSGNNILEEHCHFENIDGKVTLHALPDAITVRVS
jgi:hypothetical protein